MEHRANNYGFRLNERFHSEVQLTDKIRCLYQTCNEAAGPLIGSLQAQLAPDFDAPIAANNQWQRRTTMLSKHRLAVNTDSHAKPATISWMNH